jgi:hypothetical protein
MLQMRGKVFQIAAMLTNFRHGTNFTGRWSGQASISRMAGGQG